MRAVSLTTKLLSICSGSLAIMFTGCLYMYMKTNDHEREEISRKWYTLVDNMKSQIAGHFRERYGDTQIFAVNSILQTRNATEITKALNIYVSNNDTYDLVLLVDMNGQLVASSTVDAKNNALDVSSLGGQN